MKPLVIIPARGGSKGLPGKNTRMLNDVPLIHYTIRAALEVFDALQVCVSTDSEQIREVAEQAGIVVPFLRPVELATDTASSVDVILHAIGYYKESGYDADTVILLQPTSPFRTGKHIAEALKLYNDSTDMVVSVMETKANPYYVLFEENKKGFLEKSKEGKFVRRQDCPKVWEYNGAIYIIRIASLIKHGSLNFPRTVKYEMQQEHSVDIDTMADFLFAEFLVTKPGADRNA